MGESHTLRRLREIGASIAQKSLEHAERIAAGDVDNLAKNKTVQDELAIAVARQALQAAGGAPTRERNVIVVTGRVASHKEWEQMAAAEAAGALEAADPDDTEEDPAEDPSDG